MDIQYIIAEHLADVLYKRIGAHLTISEMSVDPSIGVGFEEQLMLYGAGHDIVMFMGNDGVRVSSPAVERNFLYCDPDFPDNLVRELVSAQCVK